MRVKYVTTSAMHKNVTLVSAFYNIDNNKKTGQSMQSVKITKSVGVVFIDCNKCNQSCPLQQQIKQCSEVVLWKPFKGTNEHMIRTRNLLVGIKKIAQNAQEFYN